MVDPLNVLSYVKLMYVVFNAGAKRMVRWRRHPNAPQLCMLRRETSPVEQRLETNWGAIFELSCLPGGLDVLHMMQTAHAIETSH